MIASGREGSGRGATSWCGALLFKSSSRHPPFLPFSIPSNLWDTGTKGWQHRYQRSLPSSASAAICHGYAYSKLSIDPRWRQKQRAAISIVQAALLSLCDVNQSCLAGFMTSKDQGQDDALPPFHQCTTPIIHFVSLKVSTITCFFILHSDLFKHAFKIQKVEGCNQFIGYKTRCRAEILMTVFKVNKSLRTWHTKPTSKKRCRQKKTVSSPCVATSGPKSWPWTHGQDYSQRPTRMYALCLCEMKYQQVEEVQGLSKQVLLCLRFVYLQS